MVSTNEKLLSTLEYPAVRDLIAPYCQSALGKAVVARLVPFETFDKAVRALDQVTEMKRYLEKDGAFALQGAWDAVKIIEDARENNKSIDPEGLYKVGALLRCARKLKAALQESAEDKPELQALIEKIEDLDDLEAEIARTVDAKGRVLGSASPQLAAIRREVELLGDAIRKKAESLLAQREVARFLQESIVTVRNGRLVLPVRTECRGQIKGIHHSYSASGNTAFVEPEVLVEKQNELEKKKVYETREITRILWERTRRLMEVFSEIRSSQRAVAWLDFTYARAHFSIDFDLHGPELARSHKLILRGARHPLLLAWSFERAEGDVEEKRRSACKEVIPFNLHLGDRFDLLVITGPNTGGKTVTLKTVGVLALMAASGLHLPTDRGTVVPYFRTVLADIGDEQDLSQNLSTFSSHMQRISEIIDQADPDCLVLLDELGTGTDPLEGEALGRAILSFLRRSRANVLVSTHLSKLKEFAFSQARVENACMEFNPDTLKPTFHLRIGMPGESNALHIARRLGIPSSVLDEAEEALTMKGGELTDLMNEVQRIRIQSEQTLEQAQRDAAETSKIKEVMSDQEQEIAFKITKLEQEADREIDACLRQGRDRALDWTRKLKNLQEPHKSYVESLEKVLTDLVERSPLGVKRRNYVDQLKKGDEVYIPRYRERCRVIKIHKKEDRVEVAYRNLSVKVPVDEIMWPHWY